MEVSDERLREIAMDVASVTVLARINEEAKKALEQLRNGDQTLFYSVLAKINSDPVLKSKINQELHCMK